MIDWIGPLQPPVYLKLEPKYCVGSGGVTTAHITQTPGPPLPQTQVATYGQQVAPFVAFYEQQGGARDLFYPGSLLGLYIILIILYHHMK